LQRDHNLGIGAIQGKSNSETFGLEVLSGLLGRLNGKSDDELEKEVAARRDVKLMRYQNEKHGLVGFVFGGYLVGDEIKQNVEKELSEKPSVEESIESRLSRDGKTSEGKDESAIERMRKKAEKRARKEARRIERQRRKLNNTQPAIESEPNPESQQLPDDTRSRDTVPAVDQSAQPRGRHLIRQKYVQQKRMACMNEKALNEVNSMHCA
jgi:Pin2-interacting protein X1